MEYKFIIRTKNIFWTIILYGKSLGKNMRQIKANECSGITVKEMDKVLKIVVFTFYKNTSTW